MTFGQREMTFGQREPASLPHNLAINKRCESRGLKAHRTKATTKATTKVLSR